MKGKVDDVKYTVFSIQYTLYDLAKVYDPDGKYFVTLDRTLKTSDWSSETEPYQVFDVIILSDKDLSRINFF